MIGIIYKITNKINNKVYIGLTIQNLKARWYRHCSNSGTKAELKMSIKKAIKKYGKDNFTIEIIELIDLTLLDEREIYWINYFNSYIKGYNQTLGGLKGSKLPKLLNRLYEIKDLYLKGASFREIAKLYNVDHTTIKQILLRLNVVLNTTRTYKLSQQERLLIIGEYNLGLSRKELQTKYKISKSYLSLLLNGNRRI